MTTIIITEENSAAQPVAQTNKTTRYKVNSDLVAIATFIAGNLIGIALLSLIFLIF